MSAKLQFLGAAQNVTGSRYLVEADGLNLLVDCGLYQERELRGRNWDPFPVPPEGIDAVLLTHAHLDHCGLLPKLVREGFSGPIYCTAATAEIAQIVLLDAAHLQEEDAAFKRKRHGREGRRGPYPEVPLYTTDDAEATIPHFTSVRYQEPVEVGHGVEATFFDAGHILGSSFILLRVGQNGAERTILFSGDMGRWDKPILRDPALVDQADYVLVESTYGDRMHDDQVDVAHALSEAIQNALEAGGKIFIPSFAVERSQELLYYLSELLRKDLIPSLPVYFDSPMAIHVTEVFERHPELFDEEMSQLISQRQSPFHLPGLKLTRTTEESKTINYKRETAIVIAGSGMCTGGRIKHHLANNISRSENTILFVGFQASGTLGRQIVDGAREVRILGRMHVVGARVEQIHGFSAHADRNDLLRWLSGLQRPPRGLFVTHGEPAAAQSFADFLRGKKSWQISVPCYKDEVVLE